MATENIPSRLHSVAQGNVVTGANEILDDDKNKKQNVINQENDQRLETLEAAVGTGGSVDSRIESAKTEIVGGASSDCNTLGKAEALISTNANDIAALQEAYAALTQNDVVVVAPSDTWPVATPAQNTIYRVVDRTNTPPQYYTDYMWNGTVMVEMAQYNNAIDAVPTAGSHNLVESGGVYPLVEDVSELKTDTAHFKMPFEEQNFQFGSENISIMSSTFNTEAGIRVNDINAKYSGYISKITIKGIVYQKVALPIYIVEMNGENAIKIVDSFTVSLPQNGSVSTIELYNGVHFLSKTLIKPGYMIGWYNSSGFFSSCYSTSGTSFKTNSPTDLGINSHNTFDVGLSVECVSELSDIIEDCFRTAHSIRKSGTFLNYNMPNYSDSEEYIVKVKPTTLANSYTTIVKKEDNNALQSKINCGVYFFNNKFGFYYGSKDGDTLQDYETREAKFTFVAGHEYEIRTTKIMNSFIMLTVTDTYTLESDSIVAACINVGYGWGAWSCTNRDNGNVVAPLSQVRYILNPSNPEILIIGDSITEGIVMAENGDSVLDDYSFLIKECLNKNVWIESRSGGGSTGAAAWVTSYLNQICHPKYVILYIGTNDSNYNTWLTNMQTIISAVQSMNAVPIIITIAPNAGGSASILSQMNTWIRESGYKYIDANIVLSLDNNGETANPVLYYNDLSHPNVKGHQLIFKRASKDIPELFLDAVISF